jgi:glycerate 2-kinase
MTLLPLARSIFSETLERVNIAAAVRSRVRCADGSLYLGEMVYPLQRFRRVMLLAIGKAAVPMGETLLSILGPALTPAQVLEGVVAGPVVPDTPDTRIQFFRGGHPLPDRFSRQAAEAILRLLAQADATTLVLFLISGGASAMVEMPLDPEITLEETAEFHGALVGSGLPITQMNVLRKHFSQVKGGRLAVAAQGSTQYTLLISDVPENALHMVGSGPSLPDPSTKRQCLEILESSSETLALPPRVLAFFQDPELQETPKADHPAFRAAAWASLLSSEDLCDNAAELAAQAGCAVTIENGCDEWAYRDAARYLIDRLAELQTKHTKVCVVSAGEVSVKLGERHGVGGRNQQFVLECARILAEEDLPFTVLSGGSDGIDGNSPAAGAFCDRTTWSRAIAHGLDPATMLEMFNSFPLFEALGDTIETGPSGNNLRDLRILMNERPG